MGSVPVLAQLVAWGLAAWAQVLAAALGLEPALLLAALGRMQDWVLEAWVLHRAPPTADTASAQRRWVAVSAASVTLAWAQLASDRPRAWALHPRGAWAPHQGLAPTQALALRRTWARPRASVAVLGQRQTWAQLQAWATALAVSAT